MTINRSALDLAVLAGEILLENGAEIDRVQGTVIRILEAFGIWEHNVFIVSNGIFVTVDEMGTDPCYAVRTVPLGSIHLGRIAAVNELSREIGAGRHPAEEIPLLCARLRELRSLSVATPPLELLACAVGAGAFCYILGGSLRDSATALLAAALLQCFLFFSRRVHLSKYIVRILGSAIVTLFCVFLVNLGLGQSVDRSIIGGIIPLVPGVMLTTAIRDFFNSDYLSGVIHLIDALLIAASIAVGVTVGLGLASLMGGAAL